MALALIAAVFVIRLLYLIWLSPYELLGDEAYYWEWSRHLDLCYYEKGPGLAYLIAASTRLFGSAEWTVRLPVVVSSAIAAWAAGRLAILTSKDERTGFFAVVIFVLLPAFQANAQICTQDGPMIAIWLLATVAALRLIRHWRAGRSLLTDWLLLAMAVGTGFLIKQSALLFCLGPLVFWLLERERLPLHKGLSWNILAFVTVLLIIAMPMVLWNAMHGWPTLAHTAGHAGMGGDRVGDDSHYSWLSLPSLIGAQLGAFGPPALILMGYACVSAVKLRTHDPERWADRLMLMCCSLPAIGFFIALSLITSVLGSWPFPSFGPLVSLLGWFVVSEFSKVSAPQNDAADISSTSRSSIGFVRVWRCVLVYGIVGWAILSFPFSLQYVPGLGGLLRGPFARISGHRQSAAEFASVSEAIAKQEGEPPILISRYYMSASELAFYMPGQPVVLCAATQLGKRPSSYDFWSNTNLADASLRGRTALMDGRGEQDWSDIMAFGAVWSEGGGRFYIGRDYQGLRHCTRHQRTRGKAGNK